MHNEKNAIVKAKRIFMTKVMEIAMIHYRNTNNIGTKGKTDFMNKLVFMPRILKYAY